MKYLKYILILVALVGICSPLTRLLAQTTDPQLGTCTFSSRDSFGPNVTTKTVRETEAECRNRARYGAITLSWTGCTFTNTQGQTIPAGPATDESACVALPGGSFKTHAMLPNESTTFSGVQPPAPAADTSKSYTLLAPLPGLKTFDPTQSNGLGAYLNVMIKILIGLAAVLSVVMIVIGGVEYMTGELAHTKEAGKERITQAILGLLIALGAYALLFTINPDLLKTDAIIPDAPVGGSTKPGTCYLATSTTYQITEADCIHMGGTRWVAQADTPAPGTPPTTVPPTTPPVNPADDPNNQGL